MDGIQCTMAIRKREVESKLETRLPIIAVTANARFEQQNAILAAGVDSVLPKPFVISDLLSRIAELVL